MRSKIRGSQFFYGIKAIGGKKNKRNKRNYRIWLCRNCRNCRNRLNKTKIVVRLKTSH